MIRARAYDAKADALFAAGADAGATSDKYVRITVYLATVLFLPAILTLGSTSIASGNTLAITGSNFPTTGIVTLELVDSGVTGHLFVPGDVTGLADLMASYVTDRQRRRTRGAREAGDDD